MYGPIAIFHLVFATTFVLAQCDNLRIKRNAEFTTHMSTDCPNVGEHNRSIRRMIMNVACKPHYTHVALQPRPGLVFNPPMVSVPRCAGQCAPGLVCVPRANGIKTIDVPVFAMEYNKDGVLMRSEKCAVAKVETHTSCTCMCPQQESDCSVKENYMRSRCKCECKDRSMKKQNCESQPGMLWEDDGCTCKCMMSNMDCTTGSTWDAETCQCVF